MREVMIIFTSRKPSLSFITVHSFLASLLAVVDNLVVLDIAAPVRKAPFPCRHHREEAHPPPQ